ncbi:hypothetical protein BDK51DRAFT_35162 [Blyttiomyces helicus]|uniref:Uncharacterized protein n=1 Tax=Blyttiomyces helicus TaxID=388810 RepID=A0A4P9VXA6_9FUNG|nr:hypothetical protein BDK51DRAFT_35162 [Blyttiomyces helicus]|eukprot:RKO83333.1 hypothetical protein BDK51DRAFT_35162 [Blyttiomyces helicus]
MSGGKALVGNSEELNKMMYFEKKYMFKPSIMNAITPQISEDLTRLEVPSSLLCMTGYIIAEKDNLFDPMGEPIKGKRILTCVHDILRRKRIIKSDGADIFKYLAKEGRVLSLRRILENIPMNRDAAEVMLSELVTENRYLSDGNTNYKLHQSDNSYYLKHANDKGFPLHTVLQNLSIVALKTLDMNSVINIEFMGKE